MGDKPKSDSRSPKTKANRKPKPRVLPQACRQRLARLAAEKGTSAAAALVGVHAQTFASLAAGLPAHRSTIALVERRLVEIDSAKTEPEGGA